MNLDHLSLEDLHYLLRYVSETQLSNKAELIRGFQNLIAEREVEAFMQPPTE